MIDRLIQIKKEYKEVVDSLIRHAKTKDYLNDEKEVVDALIIKERELNKESELIKKSLGILAHDPCYANKCRTCRYYEFFNEKKDGVCNYFRNVFMHNGEFGGFKGRIVCTECGGTYEFVNNEYTCKTCKEKEVVCGQI